MNIKSTTKQVTNKYKTRVGRIIEIPPRSPFGKFPLPIKIGLDFVFCAVNKSFPLYINIKSMTKQDTPFNGLKFYRVYHNINSCWP